MIRDFIGCMDNARKKYATLKELDPEGQVKLVPLLLDEWRLLYPGSEETVKSFLVKIKHLKTQKEIIKKHLGVSGLLPRMDNVAASGQATPAPASVVVNGDNNTMVPNNIESSNNITNEPTTGAALVNGEHHTDNVGVIKAESEVIQYKVLTY